MLTLYRRATNDDDNDDRLSDDHHAAEVAQRNRALVDLKDVIVERPADLGSDLYGGGDGVVNHADVYDHFVGGGDAVRDQIQVQWPNSFKSPLWRATLLM